MLLAGIDAGPRPGAPARLSALLDEAVDATDEPMRVDVRTGPNATVEPGAAIELLHVVSEVVDHVTAIHPGARVEVASRTEAPGGIVVEIRTASTTRYDPSAGAAWPRPPGSPSAPAAGSCCAPRCPAPRARARRSPPSTARPARSPSTTWTTRRGPLSPVLRRGGPPRSRRLQRDAPPRGDGDPRTRAPAGSAGPPGPAHHGGGAVQRAHGRDQRPGHASRRPPRSPASARTDGCPSRAQRSRTPRRRAGRRALRAAGRPARRGGVRGHPDLRGGRVGLVPRRGGRRRARPTGSHPATGSGGPPPSAPTQQPEDVTFTAGGLPRRRAGARLVPPRLSDGGAGDGAGRGGAHARPVAPAAPAERVPDRVRERLATYQRGLRQGRHRADPTRPGRSRRLVAACCSSSPTCRLSHRAVDS